jgi:hypothetical protein
MNSKSESKYRMKDGKILVNDDPKCKTFTEFVFHHAKEYLPEWLNYRQKTRLDEKMMDKHCN